jgi:hypothetical protein
MGRKMHSRDASTCAHPGSAGTRAAQHDKFETVVEEIDFPELWKSN